MAKRDASEPPPKADAASGPRTRRAGPARSARTRILLCFKIADGSFGFRLDDVGEIVRLPELAHMPLAPRSLLGLANFRGECCPSSALRRLLGFRMRRPTTQTRVIVIDRGAPVGICRRSGRSPAGAFRASSSRRTTPVPVHRSGRFSTA